MTSRYLHHHQHNNNNNSHTRAQSVSSTSTAATATTTQTSASTASTTVPVSTATGPSLNPQPSSTMAPTTSVRRNLFHHHLSRRPASAASSSSAATSASTIGAHRTASGLSEASRTTSTATTITGSTASPVSSGLVDGGDIVARDPNGNYKLDIPILPPVMLDEEGDEATMEGIEEGRPSGGSGSTGISGSGMEAELGGREKEKIEASLVEMMYQNRNRQLSSEPAEILNMIQQSLRSKVAALDEDNWMYEVEDDVHV